MTKTLYILKDQASFVQTAHVPSLPPPSRFLPTPSKPMQFKTQQPSLSEEVPQSRKLLGSLTRAIPSTATDSHRDLRLRPVKIVGIPSGHRRLIFNISPSSLLIDSHVSKKIV